MARAKGGALDVVVRGSAPDVVVAQFAQIQLRLVELVVELDRGVLVVFQVEVGTHMAREVRRREPIRKFGRIGTKSSQSCHRVGTDTLRLPCFDDFVRDDASAGTAAGTAPGVPPGAAPGPPP